MCYLRVCKFFGGSDVKCMIMRKESAHKCDPRAMGIYGVGEDERRTALINSQWFWLFMARA